MENPTFLATFCGDLWLTYLDVAKKTVQKAWDPPCWATINRSSQPIVSWEPSNKVLYELSFEEEALSVQVFVDGGTVTAAAAITQEAMTKQREAEDEANPGTTAETLGAAAAAGVPDLLRNVGEFPETFLWRNICSRRSGMQIDTHAWKRTLDVYSFVLCCRTQLSTCCIITRALFRAIVSVCTLFHNPVARRFDLGGAARLTRPEGTWSCLATAESPAPGRAAEMGKTLSLYRAGLKCRKIVLPSCEDSRQLQYRPFGWGNFPTHQNQATLLQPHSVAIKHQIRQGDCLERKDTSFHSGHLLAPV